MAPLIAGWAAGYVMAMVATVVATMLVARIRPGGWFDRFIANEVPTALLAVPISLGMMLFWTMAGLIAGAIYRVAEMEQQADGLGSPSGLFTSFMLALAVLPLPFLLLISARNWKLWLLLSASFATSFGWLLPLLGSREI